MNSNLKQIVVAGVAFMAGASVAGVAHAQHSQMMEKGAAALHETMMKSSSQMMKQMPQEKDTDRMFCRMMANHHQDGVEMAKIELRDGDDARVKKIAQHIVTSQTAERKTLLALAAKAK